MHTKPGTFTNTIMFGNRKMLQTQKCQFPRRRAPGNDEDPFNKILKILDMRSISISKNMKGNLVIWHQYLVKALNGSLVFFETKKPKNKSRKPKNKTQETFFIFK